MRRSARRTSDESVEGRVGVRRQVVCQQRLWLRESPDRRDRFIHASAVQGAELLTIGIDAGSEASSGIDCRAGSSVRQEGLCGVRPTTGPSLRAH